MRLLQLIKPLIEKSTKTAKSYRFFRDFSKLILIKSSFSLVRWFFLIKKPKSTITCYSGTDGGGAQLQRIMSVASMCHFLGIEFVYTPIVDLHELTIPRNVSKSDWINDWNHLINFVNIFKINHNREKEMIGLFKLFIKLFLRNDLYALRDAHVFADAYPNFYENLISSKGLKINFFNEQNHIMGAKKKAIIHLRVPITPSNHIEYVNENKRLISPNEFSKTVKKLKEDFDLNNSCIRVMTHDVNLISSEILDLYDDIYFDDRTDAISAVKLMSLADILVVSLSSLSYLAGLFNHNNVYYYKIFWHSPKKTWNSIV